MIDSLDVWIDRMKGPPHKCAAIFVDNSGVDIVLGILPFARELLQRGTQVKSMFLPRNLRHNYGIYCCNSLEHWF